MNHDPKKPVSLEDLLHLKRSERPPEQFWVQFESELRAKQLAAIVQHRPWWTSSERFFRLLARQALPIGATAVLALGLLSFQQYRVHSVRSEMAVPVAPTATTFKAETPVEPDRESVDATAPQAVATVAPDPVTTSAPVVATSAAPATVAANRSHPVSSPVALAADNGTDPFSALVGSPQKNVASVPAQSDAWNHFGDQQLATNSLAATVGFVPRSFATGAAEPLAHMSSPSDERRAMLLGGSLPRSENAAPDSMALSPDSHLGNRLSDERLYESVRRYGLGGNQISVRF